MIARLWSARTTTQLSSAYLEYFSQRVLPELRDLAGFRTAQVFAEATADSVEILVITFWQSLNSVSAFAGSDLGAAVVHPAAAALLTDYDQRVRHFEVLLSADAVKLP
jgi:heme-degrading monooxygenase HmoA